MNVLTWIARLALVLLSPLLLLSSIEVLAWAFGVVPLRDEPGYASSHRSRICRFGGEPENYCARPDLEDTAGRKVVAVLGGSSVYGHPKGVEPFPSQMRRMLNKIHPGEFAVQNYGLFCKDSIFVRRCAETLINLDEAQVLVIYSGHNDFANFLNPSGPRRSMFLENNAWVIDVLHAMAATRTFSLLMRARNADEPLEWSRLPSPAFEEAVEVVLSVFTENLSDIIERATERGIEVVLVTVASNLSEFPLSRDDWDLGIEKRRDSPGWEAWRDHFTDAVALSRAGRHRDANERFAAARDALPMGRAPTELNQRIRDLATWYPQVHLVDFARQLEAVTAYQGIGCDYFGEVADQAAEAWCDQFHPNTRTHKLIAKSVALELSEIRRKGGFTRSETAGSESK